MDKTSALLKFEPIFRAMTPGTRAAKADTAKALMRGFLRNLWQEDEDRNTDGRKFYNSKEKEEERLPLTSGTANSCRLEALLCYEHMTDLHQKEVSRKRIDEKNVRN